MYAGAAGRAEAVRVEGDDLPRISGCFCISVFIVLMPFLFLNYYYYYYYYHYYYSHFCLVCFIYFGTTFRGAIFVAASFPPSARARRWKSEVQGAHRGPVNYQPNRFLLLFLWLLLLLFLLISFCYAYFISFHCFV